MANPTLDQVYTAARAILADTEVPGGQIYTDSILLPHVQSAVRRMAQAMRGITDSRIIRVFYYVLPANTSVLVPTTAGVTDMQEPIEVGQRSGLTVADISSITVNPSSITANTAVANDFATGDIVTLTTLNGLRYRPAQYAVTVVSGTQFIVNGLVATGTYIGGGKAVYSDNKFSDVQQSYDINFTGGNTQQQLDSYAWRDGQFLFKGSTDQRELKVTYYSSATVPTTGSDVIEVDDSLDFLATYAAAKAARGQGAKDIGSELMADAVGSSVDQGSVRGGRLYDLFNSAVKQWQQMSPEERRRKPFGQYSTGWPFYSGY